MPAASYVVLRDPVACPRSARPWAVMTKGTSNCHGCHPTKAAATEQQKALYASQDAPIPGSERTSQMSATAPEPDPVLEEDRADDSTPCPTCKGKGTLMGGKRKCPDCGGTGTLTPAQAAALKAKNKNAEDAPTERRLTPNMIEWRKTKAPRKGDRELRTFALDDIELRDDAGATGVLELTGYASVTGVQYRVGPYTEIIKPGAFKRSLNNPDLDVCLLVNHSDLPIARTKNRSLQLEEDAHGLRVTAQLNPEDPDVQRIEPKLRAGLLTEMSFAFRCNDDTWNEDYSQRTVNAAELHRGDVSIVTNGASQATSLSLRGEEAAAQLLANGPESLLEALLQWRDLTLLPIEERTEERIGKTISSQSMLTLQQVLNLVASADQAVDAAQPLLADLLGVPNPDDDDARWGVTVTETRTQEERDTHNDLAQALASAVRDKFKQKYGSYDVGVRDFDDNNVHATLGSDGLHAIPYTVTDEGPITLGDPTPVRPQTTYVARADNEATEKRVEPEPEPKPLELPSVDYGLLARMRLRGGESR